MGSQARGDDSESVIPFTPAARSTAPDGADELDKAGQTILGLLHKAAGVPKQIVSMLSIWLRSFLTSFERPRIGSPSSRLRLACIRTRPTTRSSGYTECTPRLRTDFYARTTAVVERLNAGRARTARVEQL
jgi:hypothetical protein